MLTSAKCPVVTRWSIKKAGVSWNIVLKKNDESTKDSKKTE